MAKCTCKVSHLGCLGGVSTQLYWRNMWKAQPFSQGMYLKNIPDLWDQSYINCVTALNCICHYQLGFLAWWTGADRNKTMLTDLTQLELLWTAQANWKSQLYFKRKSRIKVVSESLKTGNDFLHTIFLKNRKHSGYLEVTNQ